MHYVLVTQENSFENLCMKHQPGGIVFILVTSLDVLFGWLVLINLGKGRKGKVLLCLLGGIVGESECENITFCFWYDAVHMDIFVALIM